MTKRLPFTQHSVRRAIAAARKEGLTVTGIRPDGTVLVQEGDAPIAAADLAIEPEPSKWADPELA